MTEDEEIASLYKEFMANTEKHLLKQLNDLEKVPWTDTVPEKFQQVVLEAYLKVKGETI